MTDTLKHSYAANRTLVGTWVTVGHPAVAELVATLGYDFVVLDGEHSPSSYETLENLVRAVDAASGDTETVVRVSDGDPVTLKRTLDVGPDAVLVPMVETPGDAKMVVEGARYPPDGVRGLGVARRNAYGQELLADARTANDDLTVLVQLETPRGVEHAPTIAGMEGIDGLFVGPVDLSLSMDRLGQWDDESFTDAVGRVVDAAHDADVGVGTLATDRDSQAERLGWGVDFLASGVDALHLADGAEEALEHVRSLDRE